MHDARARAVRWAIVLAAFVAVALAMPLFAPYDPISTDLQHVGEAPSALHLLGTDAVGRDIASRVMVGLHTSLFAAFAIVAISFVVGSIIGAVSGYVGGAFDAVVMRVVDAFMAFPSLVLSIVVAGVLGGGLVNAVIALATADWTRFARLSRSQVLAMKGRAFIEAERVAGASSVRIAVAHVIPNALPALVVLACLDVGGMMLNLAGLSFLGLGAAPPAPELGSMVNQAAATFRTAPWAVFAPGAAILVSVMVLNLFGDAVSDALAPDAGGPTRRERSASVFRGLRIGR